MHSRTKYTKYPVNEQNRVNEQQTYSTLSTNKHFTNTKYIKWYNKVIKVSKIMIKHWNGIALKFRLGYGHGWPPTVDLTMASSGMDLSEKSNNWMPSEGVQ